MPKRTICPINQKFDRWTVLADVPNTRPAKWLCRCDCGTMKEVDAYTIRNDKTSSCGCLIAEKARERFIDISGQRFGKLIAISRTDKIASDETSIWLCQCDCGKYTTKPLSYLRCGDTKSCGCSWLHDNPNDITGQRFGRLVAIRPVKMRRTRGWLCQCDCGKLKRVYTGPLLSGATRSCGCLQTESRKKRSGPNAWNWKGGITPEYVKARRGEAYHKWRGNVFVRDDYTCAVCGKKGDSIVAHHLESFAINPHLRTELGNGITLCKHCHLDFHNVYGRHNNTRKQFEEFLLKSNR